MKLETLLRKLTVLLPDLRCPLCAQGFSIRGASLVCAQGHCFDASSHGYINLAPGRRQADDRYDAALFESRRAVLDAGVYAPALEAVRRALEARFADRPFALVDAGCGEGYYARALALALPAAEIVGVEICGAAVRAAARTPSRAHWLVADVKRLPFRNGFADAILDVLTPADYTAFARVLAPEGVLVKLVPGAQHLIQIRQAVAPYLRDSSAYDNARVLAHLEAHMRVWRRETLRYTLPVSPALGGALMRMTPLTFSVPREALDASRLTQITVHMEMLLCAPEERAKKPLL